MSKYNYPRDFKGIWIPKEVWLDGDLSAIDKIVLAEIYSLDVGDNGGCYASNEYLAWFCKCSETKVSKAISKLKEYGYIKQEKTDGRSRWLRVDLQKKFLRVAKNTKQTCKKCKADLQKIQYSNIDDNNRLDDIDDKYSELNNEVNINNIDIDNKSFSNEKEERKVSYGDRYKSHRERVRQNREYSEADKVAYENELPKKMADVYREFGYENKHLAENVEFATRYFIEIRRKHINTPMLPYTHDAISNMVMAMDSEQTIESMSGGTLLTTTYQSMICSEIGTNEIESLIDSYFDTKFKGGGGKPCDYSLAHFLSDDVQKFLKAKSGNDIWWYCESEVL